MLAVHVLLAKWRKDFEADRIPHSARFFRIINEVPTVLLIGIVIMVVVRPFLALHPPKKGSLRRASVFSKSKNLLY